MTRSCGLLETEACQALRVLACQGFSPQKVLFFGFMAAVQSRYRPTDGSALIIASDESTV